LTVFLNISISWLGLCLLLREQ